MTNKLENILEPKELNDIIGYHKYLKGDGIIKKIYDNNFNISLLLYGQPGIGKTSILKILADKLLVNANKIIYLNANFENKKSLLDIKSSNDTTVLVIDEIHLFNKTNQELICGLIDTKKVILLASTTTNPYVNLIPSLRSRIQVIELLQNKDEFIDDFYYRLQEVELKNSFSREDIKSLLEHQNYDLRNTIQLINIIDNLYSFDQITFELLDKIGFLRPERVGIDMSQFHDLKSALQKSIRGSDVDASIYYLACLIKFNDLESIVRRLMIIAYEDIGLANPNLCLRVSQACETAQKIGFPEAKIILSNIVIELAMSEKSNSAYLAISKALDYIGKNGMDEVPNHIKQNHQFIKNAKYNYPFDFENNWVNQLYLPKNVNETFYLKNKYNQTEEKLNNHFFNWTNKKKGK